MVGFPDGQLECEYAQQYEDLSRSWRLSWQFLIAVPLFFSAVQLALNNDEPLYRHPTFWVALGHFMAWLVLYLSPKQGGKGRGVVAPHPWRPRRYELVGLLLHLYLAILFVSLSSFCTPVGLSYWVKAGERIFKTPMVRGLELP
jgi:hypothetical protein